MANAGSFWAGALLIASLECLNWALAIRRTRRLRQKESAILGHLALRITEMGYVLRLIADRRTSSPDALAREAVDNDMRRMAETPI
jgi:hypothetical protein